MRARPQPKTKEITSATLDTVADDLYGLAPEEFTAARADREKEARRAGDPELAASIRHLAKPTVAAWLANQLARERRDELQALPELGAGLRHATDRLAGDELRQFSRQQHELVYALIEQARQLARASGHPVSEATARGLEDTLYAALADEHAAEQLLAGRLTEPLERRGFGNWAPTDEPAPIRVAPPPAQRQQGHDEEVRRAERDLAEAGRALTNAAKARNEDQAQVADADQAAQAARREVEELRRRLDEGSTAASVAVQRRRELAKALQQAERAVSEAEHRRADAQERRDRLSTLK